MYVDLNVYILELMMFAARAGWLCAVLAMGQLLPHPHPSTFLYFFQSGIKFFEPRHRCAMLHSYEVQRFAAFGGMVNLFGLLPDGTFLDDAFVGFEDGRFLAFRAADAEVGLVEV